jgi:hypothetical protein
MIFSKNKPKGTVLWLIKSESSVIRAIPSSNKERFPLTQNINFAFKSAELSTRVVCCTKSFLLLRAGLKNHFCYFVDLLLTERTNRILSCCLESLKLITRK